MQFAVFKVCLTRPTSEKTMGEERQFCPRNMNMQWRVNALALVAAIAGLVALFAGRVSRNGFSNMLDSQNEGFLIVASWMFVVGMVACSLTQIGCTC